MVKHRVFRHSYICCSDVCSVVCSFQADSQLTEMVTKLSDFEAAARRAQAEVCERAEGAAQESKRESKV